MRYRCPECRTRRTDYRLFLQHQVDAGHKVCNGGGYHHAHRPGSKFCQANPLAVLNEAKRRDEPQTVIDEIISYLKTEGKL